MNLERSYEGDNYGPGFDFSIVNSNVEICRYAKMTTRMYQLKISVSRTHQSWATRAVNHPIVEIGYWVRALPSLCVTSFVCVLWADSYPSRVSDFNHNKYVWWVRDLVAGAPRAVLKITIPISRKITGRFQGFHGNQRRKPHTKVVRFHGRRAILPDERAFQEITHI